jgi:hypothetical protein
MTHVRTSGGERGSAHVSRFRNCRCNCRSLRSSGGANEWSEKGLPTLHLRNLHKPSQQHQQGNGQDGWSHSSADRSKWVPIRPGRRVGEAR